MRISVFLLLLSLSVSLPLFAGYIALYGNRDIILAFDCLDCVVRLAFLAPFKLHTRVSTTSIYMNGTHIHIWCAFWSTENAFCNVQSRCRFKHDPLCPLSSFSHCNRNTLRLNAGFCDGTIVCSLSFYLLVLCFGVFHFTLCIPLYFTHDPDI